MDPASADHLTASIFQALKCSKFCASSCVLRRHYDIELEEQVSSKAETIENIAVAVVNPAWKENLKEVVS